MDKIYRLVDKDNNVIFQGTYEECSEREQDRLEYVGIGTPIYHATTDNGIDITGTVNDIAKLLNVSYLTLYNYTRYKRRSDGLFLEKVGNKVVE